MSSSFQHPPIDPELADVVARLGAGLETLPALMEQHRSALEQGATLGELRGMTEEDYASLYQAACGLCDAGRFQHALPVALQLVAHEPRNSHFVFLCASCFRHSGNDAGAALFYSLCMELDKSNALAAYRLGECLASLNQARDAMQAFSTAVELCRGQHHYATLQDRAQARADSLIYQNALSTSEKGKCK